MTAGESGSTPQAAIEDYFAENRTFPPPPALQAEALVTDRSLYEQADADPEAFWAEQAKALSWFEPWERVLEWDLPFAKWFAGGSLNVS